MSKYFQRIISTLFHPLLIPLYGILVILNSGTYLSYISNDVKNVILSIYFISTIILPLSTAPLLYYQKLVSDWQFSNHKERVLPLLILSGFYIFAWFMLNRIQIPSLYTSYILDSSSAILISAIVSTRLKISIHMVGLGILSGLVLGLSLTKSVDLHLLLMLVFLISGIMGATRLQKHDTTPLMVYSGYIVGFISVFIPVNFY